MEEEDKQKGLLVAKIKQVGRVVEELQALDKGIRATKRGDEIGHVVGGKERVKPAAALVGL